MFLRLEDGRVVIAGGFEGGQALDFINLFDPAQSRVLPAGRMSPPRASFTATALAGGAVRGGWRVRATKTCRAAQR